MELSAHKSIVWLASYPKSGNTWFRAFLTALLKEGEIDLNKLGTNGIFSGKNTIENILDLNADYLSDRETEMFQRITYNHLVARSTETLFIKIHDAFTLSDTDGLPRVSEEGVRQAIYFVRNPLDVALSMANHIGKPVDIAIDKFIINQAGAFVTKNNSPYNQFKQPLGTWSMHVESWLTNPSFPVHFIKYEEMKENPFETFKRAVEALDLDITDEQVSRAIEETKFENLQRKEKEQGFREKQIPSSAFFFRGQVGRWREELTSEQIEKIRNANEPMMRRFGYW